MSSVTGIPLNPLTKELDFKTRLAPKIKPEVQRVPANPFFPGGLPPSTDVPVEKFQANLPEQDTVESKKVGTVLNTYA